ncbi:Integrator complex subunit 7, partial [Rhizopus azygosporus]
MNDGNDLEVAYKVLLELETRFNQKPRSGNLGIHGPQIQALTGYVHVFKQHPHPLIINTAILKLADWFRSYNNTVKLYILKVFKEASHHLEKVMNVDETVRRILPILGSNDPIARSLTLRVLGCMSSIIAEKLDVQFG